MDEKIEKKVALSCAVVQPIYAAGPTKMGPIPIPHIRVSHANSYGSNLVLAEATQFLAEFTRAVEVLKKL